MADRVDEQTEAVESPPVSWRDLAQTAIPVLVLCVAAVLIGVHYVRPAPPRSLTIAAGPKGSTFASYAERYRQILARSGIELRVVETQGSLDNLNRLADRKSGIDIALVQSGLTTTADTSDLTSLGSLFFEPLTVFYRASQPIQRLSQLAGRRIAIGPEGSGVRALSLALLRANGIMPGGSTTLLPLEGEAARAAFLRNETDAVFLTGDSASTATIRETLHTDGVRLFDFPQADAYLRRFAYLSKVSIPAGAFDLGENLPPQPVALLALTVELVAHSQLHPALCDLLVAAAVEVHGRASLLQSAGQFPVPVSHAFPLDAEAARYYKSGESSFLYRFLPFWLASLVNRALVVLVPIVLVVIPGLRYLPTLYNWRVNARIRRRYAELMALERESLGSVSEERRAKLMRRLEEIEKSVILGKTPGSHAEQLYLLRQHISFVRGNLARVA